MTFSSKVFELVDWAPAGYRIVASKRGLCRIDLHPELPEPWDAMRGRGKGDGPVREIASEGPENEFLDQAARELAEYFAGDREVFDVQLDLEAEGGGEFHRRVWKCLFEIPFGELTTYGAIAEELGVGRGGSRAVGQAVGRNPISVILPCHRVVGASGRLTGFSAGLSLKVKLLEHEKLELDHCGDLSSHLVRGFQPGSMRSRARSPYHQASLPLS